MNKHYDYVIIGGGPTGLTLALYLSKYGKKVVLLEKEENIGGCHSVKRVNGLFSEHGPRIYLNNYLVFSDLLQNELNISFTDIYTQYKFGKIDVYNTIVRTLTFRELIIFAMAFLNLNDSYKKISFKEFLDKYNFSNKAKDIFDRIGRLTDGGGIEQYTLFSFLQIMNQNILYDIYEPKEPNDLGLFKLWYDELIKRGVDIVLDSEVTQINTNTNLIESISTGNNIFYGSNFIFAMPPLQIRNIFVKNQLKTGFKDDFNQWSENTNYITYIPVVFHWNKKINVKRLWGYPQTSWGVGYIIMSDYMDFEDDRSITVISSAITIQNKSEYLNKTPNEISESSELVKEVFRQLKTVLPNLPDYDHGILSQNYYDGSKWVPIHTAFMTTKYGYIDYDSKVYNNLYNCGVQNGKSSYSFTSMESSVVNAIELLYHFIPESRNKIIIKEATTFRFFLFVLFLLIFVIVICFFIFYRRK